MTTFNTGNAVPSADARDRSDNSQTFDEVINGTLTYYTNRVGNNILSLKGMEQLFTADQISRASTFAATQAEKQDQFDQAQASRDAAFAQFIEGTGWSSLGAYAAGISIVSHTQTVDYLGQPYSLKPSVPASIGAPYVTTGDWATEGVNFKLVGDNSLRQDLAVTVDLTKGGTILGRATVTVRSIVDLLAHPQRVDLRVIPASYHPGGGYGGGAFLWDPAIARSSHNGGTVISPTVPWDGSQSTHSAFLIGTGETAPSALGCWVRPFKSVYSLVEFGGVSSFVDYDNYGYDNVVAVEVGLKSVPELEIPNTGKWFAVGRTRSAFFPGVIGKRLTGYGALVKVGPKGILSFNACTGIHIGKNILFDGQIVKDEELYGSIVDNGRLSANYAFAVSFANCNDCSFRGKVQNFAWDGVVAQGTVDAGGATATQSTGIDISHGDYHGIRGSQIWTKAIKDSKVLHNKNYNLETFSQKANGIFLVEWCESVEVAHNKGFYIGDNFIGIGEMVSTHPNAVNKNLKVHHNFSDMTRYHSLLIAQSADSEYTYNTFSRGGAKTAMVGPSGVVQCGAITMLGGGAAPGNLRNRVGFNTIINPFEHGFYGYDRPGTLAAGASKGNIIEFNTVDGAGTPAIPSGSTRLASYSFALQFPLPQELYGNTARDGISDGFRIFGDVDLSGGGNKAERCAGVGFHIPTDTIWSNTQLSGQLFGVSAYDCGQAGILVASKTTLSYGSLTAERCGNLPAPATETTANALLAAGVSFRSIGRLVGNGVTARGNGSSGMMTQFCPSIRDTGGTFEDNAKTFTTQNFRSGVYCEGASGDLVKGIFLQSGGSAGANQYYPVRILFGAADSVVLDGAFSGHPSGSVGAVAKSLINI